MDDQACGQLRADAARNRASVVAAARKVFAERGLDAPLDEIARRAGVGNATVYRRFGSREALVEAVFVTQMREHADAVEQALRHTDPWTGFRDGLLHVFRLQAEGAGLADLLVTRGEDGGELEQLRARALDGLTELTCRAQAAGALRPDFVCQDIGLLLMANAGVVHRTSGTAPGGWLRVASFLLDGLRTGAVSCTGEGDDLPAPLTEAEMLASIPLRASCMPHGSQGC